VGGSTVSKAAQQTGAASSRWWIGGWWIHTSKQFQQVKP